MKHLSRTPLIQRVTLLIIFAIFATLPLNGIIALKRLLLLLLVLAAAHRYWQTRAAPSLPAAVWAWFALAPLSLLWSISPEFTRSELLADALYPLLALLSVWILCRDDHNYLAAEYGLISGIAATLSAGFLSAVHTGDLTTVDWYGLAHGIGQFSTLLAMAFPFCCIVLVRFAMLRNIKGGALATGLIVAILVGGYATQNRMFWLSIGIAGVALFASICTRNEFKLSVAKILSIGMILGIPLAGGFYFAMRSKPASYLDAAAPPDHNHSITEIFTQNERYEIWGFWIQRIADHPWFGIGFGHDLPKLVWSDLKPAHWPALLVAHAHNLLVDITLQLGVVGLSVFTLALAEISLRYWHKIKKSDFRTALIASAGMAMLLATLAKNMTDDFFSRGPLFAFWVITGAVLARTHQRVK